ncbi:MAG: hypothetical protein ABI638_02870, partial [Ignavibacteriota bacterium]
MIRVFFVMLYFIGIQFISIAQEKKSCCSTEKSVSFTSFSEQQDFRDIHQIPAAFTLKEAKGKMITFNTKDGKTAPAKVYVCGSNF